MAEKKFKVSFVFNQQIRYSKTFMAEDEDEALELAEDDDHGTWNHEELESHDSDMEVEKIKTKMSIRVLEVWTKTFKDKDFNEVENRLEEYFKNHPEEIDHHTLLLNADDVWEYFEDEEKELVDDASEENLMFLGSSAFPLGFKTVYYIKDNSNYEVWLVSDEDKQLPITTEKAILYFDKFIGDVESEIPGFWYSGCDYNNKFRAFGGQPHRTSKVTKTYLLINGELKRS